MIGRVGADAHGTWLVDGLRSAGVDTTGVRVDEGAETGTALIMVDGGGQNQIVVVPGANGGFDERAFEAVRPVLRPGDVVMLQLEIPLATVMAAARHARAAGAAVILDPAPAASVPDELFELADWVTPNESELGVLAGAVGAPGTPSDLAVVESRARSLQARGARGVIVKLGAAGALLVAAGSARHVPAFPVAAVDTTAAGDAFNGALTVALLEGRPPEDAVRFACAAAAVCVSRPGAQASMPARSDVARVLGQ
jgi:ribokinase